MVTSATSTGFRPDTNGAAQTEAEPRRVAAEGAPKTCVKCHAPLFMGYYEPECLKCGYADYGYATQSSSDKQRNVVSSATKSILRYVGDFPNLSDRLVLVKLVRLRNRAVYAVACPFCKRSMMRSSLSGKRPDVREERYRCVDGHRVSLTPGKNGSLGWK
jgi:hypothetical protein